MSAMGSPTTRPRKTLEDYQALPDDVRAELIDGELYMSPAPGTPHQRTVVRLVRRLGDELDRLGFGEVFVAPYDVYLPNGDVVQPDVCVLGADQASMVTQGGVHGAPALVIEVLSPGHPERDRLVKMWRYAQSAVAEYWIVDPEAQSVEVFRLQAPGSGPAADAESRFAPVGWFRAGEAVRSEVLPGLDLGVDGLFP